MSRSTALAMIKNGKIGYEIVGFMKKLFKIFIITTLCFFAACIEEEFDGYDNYGNVCVLELSASLEDYDGVTRSAGSYEWKDGDKLFISFHGANASVGGVAEYSTKTSKWTLTYKGEFPGYDVESTCKVMFFDGAVYENDVIKPSYSTPSYEDAAATYTYSGGKVKLKAHLAPMTGRLRFTSDTEQNFTLSGLYYTAESSYSASENGWTLVGTSNPLTLSMHRDSLGGYTTDYIYASWSGDNTNYRLNIDVRHERFTRLLNANVLKKAVSGYIKMPTGAEGDKWTKVVRQYVDLGLPSGVLWATCNIGASSPAELGDLLAWGETEPKSEYTQGNSLTYGKEWDDISGNYALDAATKRWGDGWRMPTKDEVIELMDNCTCERIEKDGIEGFEVKGSNGNSIFFPHRLVTRSLIGHVRDYWTSTPYHSEYYKESTEAVCVHFSGLGSAYDVGWVYEPRYQGFKVRPVINRDAIKEYFYILKDTMWVSEAGASDRLTIETNVEWKASCSADWVTPTKENDALIVAVAKNTTSAERNATVIITRVDDNRELGRVVVIQAGGVCEIDGHEYVDLGLPSGLKWATCNVGAAKPEDYGGYYAWGELAEKEEYTAENCATERKYFENISGNSKYDVATAEWGESWRMPTKAEFEELLNNCTFKLATINDVNVYQVTGKNGNSIYLPAAGMCFGTEKDTVNMYGEYWSATPYYESRYAYRFTCHGTEATTLFGVNRRRDGRTIRPVSGKIKETEEEVGYVDLGLPSGVKWAKSNVGAVDPEDYGDYYAWGEVEDKASYNWSTYSWCYGTDDSMTKYCTNASYGTVDNKTILEPEDDVAHVKWGGEWRMPTMAEFEELRDYCTLTWTTRNGVNGYEVAGTNGNSIFLPAAGFRSYETISGGGNDGLYWSTMPYSDSAMAYNFYFGSEYNSNSWYPRYIGQSVRPVIGEVLHEYFDIDTTSIKVPSSGGEYNVKVRTNIEWDFSGGVAWVSITKDLNDRFVFEVYPNRTNTERVAIIKITRLDNGSELGTITINQDAVASIDGYEYVDLGLPSGLKWATCNVGAANPEDYGGYYAWGETDEKDDYSLSTYKWCNGTDNSMTKYCTDGAFGTVDNKTILEPEDDVAHVKWGGNWRMPTKAEQDELRDNCTWTWTTLNGVNGCEVTGPNGNSIFLPAAGYRNGTEVRDRGDRGDYLSSSLSSNKWHIGAYYLYFYDSNFGWDNSSRNCGLSVRPVSGNITGAE